MRGSGDGQYAVAAPPQAHFAPAARLRVAFQRPCGNSELKRHRIIELSLKSKRGNMHAENN
jgi:hypothetical protein